LSDKTQQSQEYLKYYDKIVRVDNWVSVALENGMFSSKNSEGNDTVEKIFENLKKARESIETESPNYADCDYELNLATQKYFDVLKRAGRLWRLKNVYAVHHFSYFIFFLFLIFLFYYFDIDNYLSENFNIPILAIQATTWGVIGSILRGFWGLWININERLYRNAWLTTFAIVPFAGGILGALIYFLILAGLVVISSNTENGDATQVPNSMIIIASSAFAGFNWDWAVRQLEKLKK
jgi:hypothetical protein